MPKPEALNEFRASFLNERTKPGNIASPPYDNFVLNFADNLKSEFRKKPCKLTEELVTEIDYHLHAIPECRDDLHSVWLAFFEGLQPKPLSQMSFLGIPLTTELQDIPFSKAIFPLIQRADEVFFRNTIIKFHNQQTISKTLSRYMCSQVAELSCFTLYVSICEDAGIDIQEVTSEENATVYDRFCNKVADAGWQMIIVKFPVLGRLIYQRIEHISSCFLKLVEHLRTELGELNRYFNLSLNHLNQEDDRLPVSSITFGLSDPHAGGRSVCKITFINERKLVYKPKCLFNEYWFNERLVPALASHNLPFPKIEVLLKDDHGWVRDVSDNDRRLTGTEAGSNEDVIARVSALAFLLNAFDLHYENVIIQGKSVFIIDLETLFSTPPFMANERANDDVEINISAVSTGLFRESATVDVSGRDPSGFFDSDVISPFPFIRFSVGQQKELLLRRGQDQDSAISFVRECFDITKINPARVAEVFRRTVWELTSDDALLQALDTATRSRTRYVFRPTSFYSRIRQRLLQPRFLKDGAIFSMELYRLFDECLDLGESEAAYTSTLIRNEIKQIQYGDIPIFWVDFRDRAIKSPTGLVQNNFFARSPYENTIRKIHSLDAATIEGEVCLLETSLRVAQEIEAPQTKPHSFATNFSRNRLSEMIISLTKNHAIAICERAFLNKEKRSSWVSYFGAVDGKRLFPDVRDSTFYGGYIGIITFLSTAQQALKAHGVEMSILNDFLSAEAARFDVLCQSERIQQFVLPTGSPAGLSIGLVGVGGALLACARSANGENGILDPLVFWILGSGYKDVTQSISQDKALDVINGCAGFIIGANAFAQARLKFVSSGDQDRLFTLVDKAFQRLLETKLSLPTGYTWLPMGSIDDLVGLSHGTLGVAAAITIGERMLRRYGIGDVALLVSSKDVVKEAVRHCDSYRESISGLWSDNRSVGGTGGDVNTSWCHGLAGIGFSYLMLPELLPSRSGTLNIIAERLCTLQRVGVDNFCCGESGVIDFMLEYARHYNDRALMTKAEHRLSTAIKDWLDTDSFQGIWGPTNPTHFPGLFQGATGINYTALRFLDHGIKCIGANID